MGKAATKRKAVESDENKAPVAAETRPKRSKQQEKAAVAAPAAGSSRRAAAAQKAAAPPAKRAAAAPAKKEASKKKASSSSAAAAAGSSKAAAKKQAAGGSKKKKPEPEPQEEADEEPSSAEEDEEEMSQGTDGAGDDEAVHEEFMQEVHAKEEELKKHCIILEQVDTDEDETTLEQLRALKRVFVPQQVQEDFIELWSTLDEVGRDDSGGEEDEEEDEDGQPDILGAMMKFLMGGKMLTTQHSNVMHAIFNSHLASVDKAIKAKSWEKAFCLWAAALMAARRETHWYEDTDDQASACAVVTKMRSQWGKLKARSDAELGGLVMEAPGSSPVSELSSYLEGLADDMRAMDYDV